MGGSERERNSSECALTSDLHDWTTMAGTISLRGQTAIGDRLTRYNKNLFTTADGHFLGMVKL